MIFIVHIPVLGTDIGERMYRMFWVEAIFLRVKELPHALPMCQDK